MPDEIQRWRTGHLWLLENCGERYRREVEEKEYTPSPLRFVRGNSVHYVAAEAHKKQMADRGEWDGEVPPAFENYPGTDKSVDEARDLAATKFDAGRLSGLSFSKDEVEEGIEKAAGRAKDAAVSLAGMYVQRVAPKIYPLGVERRIVVRPKDIPIEVSGTIDIIEAIPQPVAEIVDGKPQFAEGIVDDKTSERPPRKDAADVSAQLTLYSLVRAAEMGGRIPKRVSLIHLIKTRTGQTSVVRQDSTRTVADLRALSARLSRAVEAVKRGVFMPNTQWWGCSAKWCPFHSTCPYVEGRDRETNEE